MQEMQKYAEVWNLTDAKKTASTLFALKIISEQCFHAKTSWSVAKCREWNSWPIKSTQNESGLRLVIVSFRAELWTSLLDQLHISRRCASILSSGKQAVEKRTSLAFLVVVQLIHRLAQSDIGWSTTARLFFFPLLASK